MTPDLFTREQLPTVPEHKRFANAQAAAALAGWKLDRVLLGGYQLTHAKDPGWHAHMLDLDHAAQLLRGLGVEVD